jgi:plastocyanin
MRFSIAALALVSSVASVLAVDHLVLVGDNQTLTFNPTSITANVGDTVSFEFRSKNHSVTQSTFADPCSIMTTPVLGVDSGFQATANGTTTFAQWQITIESTAAPLWFFCAQTIPKNHCETGMVFAINTNVNKTFAAYQQNALNLANATNTASVTTAATAGATTTGSSAVIAGSVTTASAGSTSVASVAPLVTSQGTVSVVPTAAVAATGAIVSGTTTASPSTSTNGAVRMGSTISGILSVAGVLAVML